MASTQIKIHGQEKFEDVGNKIFFNVWIQKPDSSILPFVKKYVPFLASEPKGWKVHLSMTTEKEPETLTIQSFIFTHHPYVNFKFSEGQIDFLTRETENVTVGIRDIHLWFMFDTLNDAELAFASLVEMFEKLSTKKDIRNDHLKKTAEFIDEKSDSHQNKVEFILMEDELNKNKFKIFFRIGMDDKE